MKDNGHTSKWVGSRLVPLELFCLAIVVVFGIRATGTLLADPGWDLPGTGWRSVWQIAIALVAVSGLIWPRQIRLHVGIIGAVYLLASALELFDGTVLVGAIPVDSRDRIIHPLIFILALAAVSITRMRRPANSAGPV